jgi:hypothetical protein
VTPPPPGPSVGLPLDAPLEAHRRLLGVDASPAAVGDCEVPTQRSPFPAKWVRPLRAESSSTLDRDTGRYAAALAVDGRPETAWVEGEEGPGLGSRVSILPEAGDTLPWPSFVAVTMGYAKSRASWDDNHRPRRVRFVAWHTDDDADAPPRVFELSAAADPTPLAPTLFYLACDCVQDMTCGGFSRFDFEVLEVDEGAKYDDTAISEISFYGGSTW